MGDLEHDHLDDTDEPLDPPPAGPLLRDPPAPPGYTNPLQESDLLEEPFAAEEGP